MGRPLRVGAKAAFSSRRVFVQMRGQMYDHIVVGDHARVVRVEDIQMRAARVVVGIEETTDVRAEITAAACDENSQVVNTIKKSKRKKVKGKRSSSCPEYFCFHFFLLPFSFCLPLICRAPVGSTPRASLRDRWQSGHH